MGKLLANCSIRDPNNKFFLSLNEREIVKPKLIRLSPPLCRGITLQDKWLRYSAERELALCGLRWAEVFDPLCFAILDLSRAGARRGGDEKSCASVNLEMN